MKIPMPPQRTTHALAVLAALAVAPATVSASELGRLDLVAPGAMISTCGGLNASGSGYAIGDKGVWLPGLFNCNAAQTAVPGASVAQSANYFSTANGQLGIPAYVDATAQGQATMGEVHLHAYSKATADAGFAQAEATGGWADLLTLTPLNAADIGKTAQLSFAVHVDGTLLGQGANFSFNSMANFGLKPYINDASLPPGPPPNQFVVGGQGQNGFPYQQTVDQIVGFTGNVTLGTPFELGVFARALAGNASSGALHVFNEATVDFSSTLRWAGISALTVDGAPVAYTLSSASGIDWTQPYAPPVPEPGSWALMLLGLGGLAAAARRRRGQAAQ